MKYLFIVLCIFFTFREEAFANNLRYELLKVAQKEDPNFPDGISSKLTHFSISCRLYSNNEFINVVDQRAVLTGMLSPRGINQVSFFDQNNKLIGSLRYIFSRPLWCENSSLYLLGAWDGAMPGDTKCGSSLGCNVIKWSKEKGDFVLLHEKKYGSSGGVEDP